MELSQTTLIEAMNKVLENIGERRVLNRNSPVARKCYEALTDALEDLSTLSDWEWCKDSISAESWVGDTADLGDTQRIHGASYGSVTYGYRPIAFENLQSYDLRPLQPFVTTYDRPRTYTISSYNRVRINPYPVTAEQQSMFKFYVTRSLVPPVNDTDYFPIPERFMVLLYYRAQHMLAINHLDDPNAAQAYAMQFESLAARLRDREQGQPVGGQNMFRLRKYLR